MSKHIIINAKNLQVALSEAAHEFQVPESELTGELLSREGENTKYQITHTPPPKDDNTLKNTDLLLDKLEGEIEEIETNEIVEGFTSEELNEKGLIGDKKVEIKRSQFTKSTKEKEYTFCTGVEYYVCDLYTNIDELPFADIEHLADVFPGTELAKKKSKVVYTDPNKFKIQSVFTDNYLKVCNVDISYENQNLIFKSLVKGKVVLFNDQIYVIISDVDGYCKLKIAPDKMSVKADLSPSKGNGEPLSLQNIRSQLHKLGVIFGINDKVIQENITLAQETGQAMHGIVIVEGLEPVNGEDAAFILNFSKETEFDDFRILPDGRVDYRKRAKIKIVQEGKLLAKITEPGKGTDGRDVFGDFVKAKDGDQQILYAGENVKKSENGLEFYATNDGQPVLNKNILNVFSHYLVPGDVDYNSGNIEFDGNVTINGNVLPGFEVKAKGDIIVMGTVDSAMLDAGRDIKVIGGIIGNNDIVVKCGRNLLTTFLQNAFIEVQGDVIIKDSTVHSEIYSTGNVVLREGKGSIVGGLVHALKSVDAKIIGSRSETKTRVVVGQDFLVKKMIDEFTKAKEFCQNNIEKIETFLKPLLQLIKNGTTIDVNKKQRLALVLKKHQELNNHYKMMEAKIKAITQSSKSNVKAVVKVHQTVYPDVSISIKELSTKIHEKASYVNFYIDVQKNQIVKSIYKTYTRTSI